MASAERTHRWLRHCCRPTLCKVPLGRGWMPARTTPPPPPPTSFSPSFLDSCFKTSHSSVARVPKCARAAESTRYTVPSGVEGAFQSNWRGSTDERLSTTWPRYLKGQRGFILPAVFQNHLFHCFWHFLQSASRYLLTINSNKGTACKMNIQTTIREYSFRASSR